MKEALKYIGVPFEKDENKTKKNRKFEHIRFFKEYKNNPVLERKFVEGVNSVFLFPNR
ncbi:MAG TPA: hypothetical protein PKW23_07195 [Dictyoglomaceae bacterium]|nr:hypothetical protein [Dictyoglomaceae bacterium]HOL40094.1 hypothetical protein [Dictyoglomaceae bacterium]HOP95621.1 hypothetical protein [Dictyoglomaceae bacterium]HPU43656.1 hypothetical protein [Dictyoglomaceae bacterium]